MVSENEDDPGDRQLIGGRLLFDRVAAGHPGVTIIRSGRPEMTERMLERLKNQNRRAVQQYLDERGERIDADSFERVLQAVNKAILQAREQVLRYADGDYRADPNGDRFPSRNAKTEALQTDAEKGPKYYLLTDVYHRYAVETEQAPSTRKKWGRIIEQVAEVHPDIRTITPDWCVAWKDTLLDRGLSPRSVQLGYLAALRSTCEWGKTNRRISTNPVEGIGVKVKKTPSGFKMRGYSDTEAKFVLGLTLQPVTEKLSSYHKAARRWIPWVCCYSGARVGEIAQLRKEDVKIDDGIPLLWITPEAGAVKDKNPRYVAVHPHLIEQGFLDFVASSKQGPLFFDPNLARGGSEKNPQSKKIGERISAWIRKNGITDERLAPNHAWRHRFKTKCRISKVDPGTRDYMQGHVPHNDAEGYGEFPPEALRHEIEKLPWVKVG
ncbi:hypothetical protein [Devosia sp. RR2S18]|uniref:hypothetical protein n=1 Tax=Devosia rhizosphaerae TaxID=3049774 RepID=UPI0025409A0F|nr:hypothetical protein [Devosia sp. RR2S18]WIJ25055.1 hypothetical protein QOV41_18915 [Devosia sp. RR2S18]